MSDFDWSVEKPQIEAVCAVAVYTNGEGKVVVRQQDMFDPDDDHLVVIPKAHIAALIKALEAEAN